MQERTMGNCKHGRFYLDEGCPQCIAEARAEREKAAAAFSPPPNIVKVRYFSEATGELSAREYTYFSIDRLAVGDVVMVPVRDTVGKAKVTTVDVPESEIAAFRDKIKTILKPSAVIEPAGLAAAAQAAGAEVTEAKVEFKLFPDPGPYGVQEWPQEPPPPSTGPNPPAADIGDAELEAADEPMAELEADLKSGSYHGEAPPDETLPAPLVLLNTQVDPMTVAMNPELVHACQKAGRLLEIAQGRKITTNADLKPAADDLAIIRKGIRFVQEIRKRILAPFKMKVDTINAAFADILRPLEEADRLTAGQVTAFDNEQRRRTAAAARIDEEKNRLAREEAALKNGEITVDLTPVEAPPPVPAHTRTDLGTLGGRDNWKARVVNFKLLPDEWKIPNESLLNSHARTTKGERSIPGVEFYNDRIVTMRTK